MYTSEDDHEASSRIRQKELAGLAKTQPQSGSSQPTDQLTGEEKLILPAIDPGHVSSTSNGQGSGHHLRAILALTIACVAVLFTALDQTVVVTALPNMFPDLQLSFAQLDHAAWIISAYLLGFVIAMPLMGRVSDIYGRRRIFLLCLVIFGIASVFCALAPWFAGTFDISFLSYIGIDTSSQPLLWLVGARLIQALGGGAIIPIAMAIAGDFYGPQKRALALGIIGAVTEAGGAFGPLYGALVVEHWGWKAIFYLNAPLVLILFIAGWFFIPRGRRVCEGIDWLGAVLLAISLTCLSIGLAQQGTSLGPVTTQGGSANNPLTLILAVVFFILFIIVELNVRWPVVDLSNFKRLTFSASSLVSLLIGAALIIAMTDIPIYVDTVLQQSVLASGLALLRLTVMIPIGAIVGGWLCHRLTCRWIGIVGIFCTALGFFLMSQWPVIPSEFQLSLSTMVAGLGFGLVIAPISATAINAVSPSQAGASSAIVTALRMIGMTLGLSILTSWALAYFKQLASLYSSPPSLNTTPAQLAAWLKGYTDHLISSAHVTYTSVFLISMCICLVALIPAFFLWGRQAPMTEPVEQQIVSHDDDNIPITSNISKDWKHKRIFITLLIILLIIIVGSNLFATLFGGNNKRSANANLASDRNIIQIALDKDALTSVFAAQLNVQQGILSDLMVAPAPNDGLMLSFRLHIDHYNIHRVIPVEIDSTFTLDQQQNLQLTVKHLKRDGQDADAKTISNMQKSLNLMLRSTVMPALRSGLKDAKLVSVHTSTTVTCAKDTVMFVLQIQAPVIPDIAAQLPPMLFCFKGPVDLKKLLPNRS